MPNAHILSAGLVAAGLALAAGPAVAEGETPAERGREVVAQWCSDCHATGDRRAADVGPTFADIARRRSPDYIEGFLANPHVRGTMPPFDLSRVHIEEIVAYIETLKK